MAQTFGAQNDHLLLMSVAAPGPANEVPFKYAPVI
jgi:hypothetical protein